MKSFAIVPFMCGLLTLAALPASGAAPHLVRDINRTVVPANSTPTDFIDQGSWAFFTASDGVRGREPWSTDGTASGTHRLGAINPLPPGVSQYQTRRAGGLTYFVTSDPTLGFPLWVSNGTAAGTQRVFPASDAPKSWRTEPVGEFNGELLFTAADSAEINYWLTDGTRAGTHLAIDLDAGTGARGTTIIDDEIFFLLERSGQCEAYVSDGTTAGTERLEPSLVLQDGGLGCTYFIRVGDYLIFSAIAPATGKELWRIDLNTHAISLVEDIAPGADWGLDNGDSFTTLGAVGVFIAINALGQHELWRTDGTAGGTRSVASVSPLNANFAFEGPVGSGHLLFNVDSGAGYTELWSTDGNTATQLRNAGSAYVRQLGSRMYFTARLAGGSTSGLFVTDGTVGGTRALNGFSDAYYLEVAGDDSALYIRELIEQSTPSDSVARVLRYDFGADAPVLLKAFPPSTDGNPNNPRVFGYSNGKLFFDGYDIVTGQEIWVSDGTALGTRQLVNLAPETQNQSSIPREFVAFKGLMFFSASDGVTGDELWTSDGTDAGTRLVKDVNPGTASSEIAYPFTSTKHLYFFAKDATNAYKLWVSGGTEANTQALATMQPPSDVTTDTCGARSVQVGAFVYFMGYDTEGYELWRSDGTAAGTRRVTKIDPDRIDIAPCWLTVLEDQIYFMGSNGYLQNGFELWKLNPATGVASIVKDINPGANASDPRQLTVWNGALYFFATSADGNPQLWTSDGTSAGTVAVSNIDPVDTRELTSLTIVNGRLLFVRNTYMAVPQVWRSDGTTAGTAKIIDLDPGPTEPTLVSNGRFAAFANYDLPAMLGYEPWVTDGTLEGTRVLLDMIPGQSGSSPRWFQNFNGTVVFLADDGNRLPHLWRTNGTAEGTRVIGGEELIIYTGGPVPLAVGGKFFFDANDGASGAELYVLENELPTAAADSGESVTAGESVTIDVLGNDSDADGSLDAATVLIESEPENGTATVNDDGTISYRADAGFAGEDSFSYSVADEQGGRSAPVTVSVTVVAAPEPEQPSGGGGGGGGVGIVELLALLSFLLGRRGVRYMTSSSMTASDGHFSR